MPYSGIIYLFIFENPDYVNFGFCHLQLKFINKADS